MSRVGKYPVMVPKDVTVSVTKEKVTVKGKLGEMSFPLSHKVTVAVEDGRIVCTPVNKEKETRAMWGTMRAQINNLVKGVSVGFKKKLEMVGVGYKAQVQGKVLKLSLGFSHDIDFPIPEGIKIVCTTPTNLEISGCSKLVVGQVAAKIRAYRGPEPYKGKGIKYEGEEILRKEGKKK